MRNYCTRAFVVSVLLAVVAFWLLMSLEGESYSFDSLFLKILVTFPASLLCYVVWDLSQWKPRAARAVFCVATLSTTLFLVEVPAIFGWVDYRTLLGSKIVGGEGPQNRKFDRELIFHRPPLDHFTARTPGDLTVGLGVATNRRYEAEYRYDANGFRNPPDLRQADVVLLGDSFVEGYHTRKDETTGAELGRLLDVPVANLGQVDYGPAQSLVVLNKFAFAYRPKVVVWFFFEGNDLRDLEHYKSVQANWQQVLDKDKAFWRRSFLRNARELLTFNIDLLHTEDTPLARRRSVMLSGKGLSGEGEKQAGLTYFGMIPQALTDRDLELLKQTGDILREAKTACDQHGVRFLVVNVPMKFRVYGPLCEIPEGSDMATWRLNDLPDRLANICQAEGIEFIDLTVTLSKAAAEGVHVYLPDDGHWSKQGHATVAEEIADAVSSDL